MIKFIFFTALFFVATQAHSADKFVGHWSGQGRLDQSAQPEIIQMDVQIEQTDSQLKIHDCWKTTLGQRCYDSLYDLSSTAEILQDGHRIGDIYPFRISIFLGNAQVSEQMLFELNGQNRLRYRYTYANTDGEMQTRFGELSPL